MAAADDGVVSSARARPGERNRRAAEPLRPGRLATPDLGATPSQTRSRSTSAGASTCALAPARATALRNRSLIAILLPAAGARPPAAALEPGGRGSSPCPRDAHEPATSATGRSSSKSSRQTSRSGLPGGPSVSDRLFELRARRAADLRVGRRALRHRAQLSSPWRHGPRRRSSTAACRRAMPHSQAPRSPRAGSLRAPRQAARNVSCNTSSTSAAGKPGAQPRGEPGRVANEQLTQRRIIAFRKTADQLVIVHHLLCCILRAFGSRDPKRLSQRRPGVGTAQAGPDRGLSCP